MAHAERCPVCGGSGKLRDDGKTTCPMPKTCHGCSGKGWITVQDSVYPHPIRPRREIEPIKSSDWQGAICYTSGHTGEPRSITLFADGGYEIVP